jgi:hypothetical protein
MNALDFATYRNHFQTHAPHISSTPSPHVGRVEVPAVRRHSAGTLLDRIMTGDIDAAEELRSRYFARLFELARVITNDDDEGERVVEAALEAACNDWPPPRGDVERWLKRLVRRHARARRQAFWGLDS